MKFAWLLFLPALMGSDIYRWVDANGVVNYTQQVPEGVTAERIVNRGGANKVAVPTAAESLTAADPDAGLSPEQKKMKQRLESAEKARQDEITRIKQSNCDRASRLLEKLSSKGRIRLRDDNGEETAMPEDERQSRIAEAQRDIVSNCEVTG